MLFKQFNPTVDEIVAIRLQNRSLPEVDRTCYKCGHRPCDTAPEWCDVILENPADQTGNYEEAIDLYHKGKPIKDIFPILCCDGQCSF